jgi:hypothetical protein
MMESSPVTRLTLYWRQIWWMQPLGKVELPRGVFCFIPRRPIGRQAPSPRLSGCRERGQQSSYRVPPCAFVASRVQYGPSEQKAMFVYCVYQYSIGNTAKVAVSYPVAEVRSNVALGVLSKIRSYF